MYYIGIDQSLTNTGVVVLNDLGECIETKKIISKQKGIKRIYHIWRQVKDIASFYCPCVFATEGYSFNSVGRSRSITQAGEVKVAVELAIHMEEWLCVSYASQSHRSKTIGWKPKKQSKNNGHTKVKEEITKMVNDKYGTQFNVKQSSGDHNLADAYTIAEALRTDIVKLRKLQKQDKDKFLDYLKTKPPFKHLDGEDIKLLIKEVINDQC